MDMSKIIWLVVIVAIIGGGWFLTGSGMEKMYGKATSSLPGNDPEQDVTDEATLSRYGKFNLSLFRYEQSKKFYTAAINRYGLDPGPPGKNYWSNVYQLARVEEKLENEPETIKLLHHLWMFDATQHDKRVPNRDILKSRITRMLELNEIPFDLYPMNE